MIASLKGELFEKRSHGTLFWRLKLLGWLFNALEQTSEPIFVAMRRSRITIIILIIEKLPIKQRAAHIKSFNETKNIQAHVYFLYYQPQLGNSMGSLPQNTQVFLNRIKFSGGVVHGYIRLSVWTVFLN